MCRTASAAEALPSSPRACATKRSPRSCRGSSTRAASSCSSCQRDARAATARRPAANSELEIKSTRDSKQNIIGYFDKSSNISAKCWQFKRQRSEICQICSNQPKVWQSFDNIPPKVGNTLSIVSNMGKSW